MAQQAGAPLALSHAPRFCTSQQSPVGLYCPLMNPALFSLGALLVTIIVSCTIRLHVGFLAITLAWLVGVYVAGMSANEVMAGFPTRLFLTLTGVTLLFSQAQANGTLDRIAHKAVHLCRGNVGVMPMMFFSCRSALHPSDRVTSRRRRSLHRWQWLWPGKSEFQRF